MTPDTALPTRKERWTWGAVVALVICAGFAALVAVDARYFFVDDTESGAVGNWLQLGHLMREGQWFPTLVLDQWMSGNYPVEGQGGLFNPVQMAINYVAPSVDNLVVLVTVVKLLFSILLGWGVYRVALEYGARPAWAAVAGASAPFVGFTLYFEQTSWVTSMIGTAYVMQAWASGVRYARGRSGPLPVFAFLYLAITVGYVHAALLAGVVVAVLMIGEYLYQRQWKPSMLLALVGIAAASAAAITFLPGVLSSSVTWRTGEEGVYNDNFLTAPWSETLTASMPSAVSSIESWTGETTFAPVTYISWFLVPALAFVGWRAAQSSLRELSPLLLMASFALLFTAGPSAIGQVRWPARLLPVVAVVLLILVVVLLSRFGTLQALRTRVVAASLLVLVLLLRASSSGPQYFGRHLLWALAILAVGALALFLARRYGTVAVTALILLTIVPVAAYQATTYPQALHKWFLPATQTEAKANFPQWDGVTLQLGARGILTIERDSPELPWQSQVYGNYAKILDLDYVNAYTPVGHGPFSGLLCMNFDSSTCPDALDNVFQVDPYTQETFVDLMQVDRVVLQRKQYPDADRTPAPPGWHWAEVPAVADDEIYVLERDGGPISDAPGRVSAALGVDVEPVSYAVNRERLRVSSVDGGSVVFSRLAWPGYTATLNGDPLPTMGIGEMFLFVDIPPGTVDGDLEIEFRPPGWRVGQVGIAFGLLLLTALTVYYYRGRRATTTDSL
ncbi:hypothetical protein G4H71_08955 [Rhodococcus triatomae]|uniref:Membrane protein involved in the export of O-antigen and teichoic acid n=1 Tax=Rhodococcus triatomae TaxID=300028 RepID=A0A1G8I346_9NOCA|nr:hypothetical protein [Rhodococcus triatomae]QNG20941.1 hypothetical protein G4H72_21430 [Rhodococcus triatomae]QNG23144.1 hypothetical protein G4H71_08955 [Rhodococcus triatomae]SDI13359.1 Membrane protein involved in the export of O-antigen and teichoic acid [Rhodococcus triatomae]